MSDSRNDGLADRQVRIDSGLQYVTRDGTTVTATLHLVDDTSPMVPYQAVFQRDSFTVPG